MRTISAAEAAVLAALTRTVTKRVKIANGSGTMVDLSSWLVGGPRNEDIDQPVAGLTLEFVRANGVLETLSPLRTDSTLNRLDDGVTYGPQIDLVRAITYEVATTPLGVLPGASDFKLKFKGSTSTVSIATDPIAVECRDEGGRIVDQWVEAKKTYGAPYPGVAVKTVMQSILDDVFGVSAIPLYAPAPPAWMIEPEFQQQMQSVMDAQVALAQNSGWDVRYKWDDGTSAFRFTLSEPARTKTVPDHTFGPSDYFDVSSLELSEMDIRNVVIVEYWNRTSGVLERVTVSDAASITKYRRRPLIISEDNTSPINTLAEATTLANAALADMKDPKAEMEIVLPFFWPAELGDLYRFSANGVHFNTDQDWAVVSITDELSPGRHETTLRVRGNPAGQYLTWLGRGGTIGGPTGGGTAKPPVPIITPLGTEIDESSWDFRFDATYGTGGGGINLTYTIDEKSGFGPVNPLAAGDATSLPLDLTVFRGEKASGVLVFSVTDAATGMTAEATWPIPSKRGEIDDDGNVLPERLRPGALGAGVTDDRNYALNSHFNTAIHTLGDTVDGVARFAAVEAGADSTAGHTAAAAVADTGGRPLLKMFVKPLAITPDTLDGIPDGATTYGRSLLTRLNAGRPVVDFTEAIHTGKNLDNIPDTATRFGAVEANANNTESRTSADTTAVSGRAAGTVKDEAIAGASADTDLTGFDTSGYLNRTLKRVLKIRDDTAGVDVTGATARYGYRLVDTGDALKLPASETTYAAGATVESLKPAAAGADVTGANMAASVGGVQASKLAGIAAGADVTSANTAAAVGGAQGTKLAGIAAGADVTGANTAAAVGGAQGTKLAGIATGADVTSANTAAAITNQGTLATVNLVTPSLSTPRMRCRTYHNANPSINNVTATALPWNSEAYDTGSLHDTVTANTKIVIPAGGDSGLWMISAQVQWDTNTTGMREVKIRKNGSNDLSVSREAPIVGQLVQSTMATDDSPTVGDYYEALVTQDSGAARTITGVASNFTAVHLW